MEKSRFFILATRRPAPSRALARRGPAGATAHTDGAPWGVLVGHGRMPRSQVHRHSAQPLFTEAPVPPAGPSSSRYPGPTASGPDPCLCPLPLRPPAGPLSPLFLPSGAPGLCSGLCPLRTSLGHGAGSPSPQPLRLSSLPVSSAGSGTIRKPPFSLSCAPGQGQ